MDDQLSRIRTYFPAEVTAAYLGLIGILKANGYEPGAFDQLIAYGVVPIFIAVNVWIYWRFKNVRSAWVHIVLALGFALWVANIDTQRFRDVLGILGENIELTAPVGLVLYVLITSFISLPGTSSVPAPTPDPAPVAPAPDVPTPAAK